ncbi:hypothetical protein AK830_g11492 [Neonectria ditissima]|uniref:AB hydrolase-1 domain-containing protein n=1 Tax=Neonectria ditissima TaxID=78410 RepID=A0A0P7B7Z4_9HYPO|nr:hypothetical protein AK830_g11492 [Neonectria ditissima]
MSTTDGTVRPPSSRAADHADEYRQQPVARPAAAFFPLGYKDAAYQWWSNLTPQAVEHNVLKFMPFLKEATDSITNPNASDKPDPYGTRIWRRSMVQLSGKDRALNEVSVERVGEEAEETLVMLHGYGAGLGFYYKNFEPISRVPGLKLYALDMLGMGNSTRPPFKIHAKKKEDQVIEAESWFIDALEEWRKARKIERFTLLGHSLGGYLAVSYAIKYPGHLKKLILASPVGIPEDPYAVNAAMPEPQESTLQSEFTQDQQATTEAASTLAKHKPAHVAIKRPLPSWFVWLWDANISPFSIVRLTGPLGPRFVSGWSSRRFNHLPPNESRALHDYSFSIFKQKGSGEYALAYILAPGAYARRPVINRIQEVGRQSIPQPDNAQALKETGIPIVFMYGENDWMDVAGGLAAKEKLNQAKREALLNGTEEEKRRENGSTKVILIPKAGHHLYLDNPDEFNDTILKELEDTRESERGQRAF